jgi:hypothetical protein
MANPHCAAGGSETKRRTADTSFDVVRVFKRVHAGAMPTYRAYQLTDVKRIAMPPTMFAADDDNVAIEEAL